MESDTFYEKESGGQLVSSVELRQHCVAAFRVAVYYLFQLDKRSQLPHRCVYMNRDQLRLKTCLSASGLPRAPKTNTRSANRWGIRALATRSLPGLSSKSISKIINRFGSRSVRLLREVFGSLKYQPPPFPPNQCSPRCRGSCV